MPDGNVNRQFSAAVKRSPLLGFGEYEKVTLFSKLSTRSRHSVEPRAVACTRKPSACTGLSHAEGSRSYEQRRPIACRRKPIVSKRKANRIQKKPPPHPKATPSYN